MKALVGRSINFIYPTHKFCLFVIILMVVLVYSNTLEAPFQWDEDAFIVENPFMKDIKSFFSLDLIKNRPLNDAIKNRYFGYLSFAINFYLHGFNVRGYHITNITIHVITSILVYFFVLLTFRTPLLIDSTFNPYRKTIALFCSLMFAVHPIQTEAVTYIFQRLASMAAMFYMGSFIMYLLSRNNKKLTYKIIFYVLSLIFAIMAMKTKENTFTLPFMILIYEFVFYGKPKKRKIAFLIPMLLTSLIIPISVFDPDRPFDVGYAVHNRWHYLLTQFTVLVRYITLLFLPIGQNLDHDWPIYKNFLTFPVIASFLALLSLIIIAAALIRRSFKKERELAMVGFGILWFFLAHSVESSVIPLPTWINEYRVYLPSVGWFTALCISLFFILERSSVSLRRIVLILTLIVSTFGSLAYLRNAMWCDRFVLWEDVVKKSPNNPRAYNNLGIGYIGIRELDKAMDMFNKALELNENFSLAYHNRGEVFLLKGDLDSAMVEFNKALKIDSNFRSYISLGKVYLRKKEFEKAFENFRNALALNPFSDYVLGNFAQLYFYKGEIEDALVLLNRLISKNPKDPTWYLVRGKIYFSIKEYSKAAEDFAVVVDLDPTNFDARLRSALAFQHMGSYERALEYYDKCIQQFPKRSFLYEGKGLVFHAMGHYDRAIAEFSTAISINEKSFSAYANRGSSYLAKGDLNSAISDLSRAIEINPRSLEPYINRAMAYGLQGRFEEAGRDLLLAKTLSGMEVSVSSAFPGPAD